MSEQYKISLGVDVDVSDIQSQINTKAKDVSIPIKLEVENIGDIKKQIQGLGVLKGGIEIPLSIDSGATIKSAQQVGQKIGTTITKEVNKSLDFDDSVVNNQITNLMKNAGIAAKKGSKDFKVAFDEIKQAYIKTMSGMGSVDDVIHAIAKNVKRVDVEKQDALRPLLNQIQSTRTNGSKILIPKEARDTFGKDAYSMRASLGNSFVFKNGSQDLENYITENLGDFIDMSKMTIDEAFGELVHKYYEAKNPYYSVDELFSSGNLNRNAMAEEIVASFDIVRNGQDELVQSSNAATNVIVQDSKKQQEAHENSSKANLDRIKSELEQAKQREKEIDRLIEDNNKRFQEATISGDTDGILSSQNRMDELDAESKAIKAHIDTLNASYEEAANARKNITQQISGFDDAKQTLKSLDFNTNSLDKMIGDFEELGVTVKKVTHSLNKDGSITFNVEGIDEAKNIVKAVKTLKSDGSFGGFSSSVSQDLKASEKFLKQQKQTVANLTNQINQINRSATDQNASRPIKDTSHLDALSSKYDEITAAIQRMNNASDENTFADAKIEVERLISEYKSLIRELRNAENVSSKMKGTDFASGLDIAKNDLEKFKAQAKDFPQIAATIRELDEAIEGVGDASSLNEFTDKLKVARAELAKVKAETIAANRSEKVGIDVSGATSRIADIQRISPEINEFKANIDGAEVSVESLLNDLSKVNTAGDFSVVNKKLKSFVEAAKASGIAVTETVSKMKSVEDIKLDIELGKYDNKMDAMRVKFNSLSNANDELRNSYEATEKAYAKMMNAAKANTGDEVADRARLIQAEKEYAAALEKTNNLYDKQYRANKIDNDAMALSQKAKGLSLDMDNWLKDNSAAAKQFGDTIRELKIRLESCDDVEFNNIKSEFQNIKKEAKALGLTTKTVGDKLKQQFAQYSAYLGVAEIFMWVEQGLRSMYDAVVEIDTAMTGLYRVTDLTSAEYDSLFSNMIDSAKEYGATLNDIINATSDWVRAGFDADTALGLAEVTTMYQHISDLDYDTAAENLITAYNGFKNELDTAFSGDTVGAVNYIADILNELDKQNCP